VPKWRVVSEAPVEGGPRLPKNKAKTPPYSYPKELFPRVVDGSFVFSKVSMTEFAEQLTHLRGIELPVVDRTGIQGVYDVTLKSAPSAILETDGPSLLSLIQEQLELKLASGKDLIEVVIIDHAESLANPHSTFRFGVPSVLSSTRQLYRSKHFRVQYRQTRSSPASGWAVQRGRLLDLVRSSRKRGFRKLATAVPAVGSYPKPDFAGTTQDCSRVAGQ
jgi:hypothetical protein